jgi:hypothetical protein
VTSLVPIATLERRVSVWRNVSGREIPMFVGDQTDPVFALRRQYTPTVADR